MKRLEENETLKDFFCNIYYSRLSEILTKGSINVEMYIICQLWLQVLFILSKANSICWQEGDWECSQKSGFEQLCEENSVHSINSSFAQARKVKVRLKARWC